MNLDRCTRGQLFAIALAAVALGAIPHIIRLAQGNPLLPGTDIYAHLLAARHLLEPGVLPHAPLTPYHALLAGLGMLTGLEHAGRIISAATALLTVLAFYHLGKSFKLPAPVFGPLVLLLSPSFIASAAIPSPRSLSVLAALAALMLISRTGFLSQLAASLLLALAATAGLPDAVIAVALPVIFAAAKRQARRAVPALLPLAVALSFHLPALAATPAAAPLRGFFSDFGGLWGFGVFAVLLALVGLVALRRERRHGLGLLSIAAAIVILAGTLIPSLLLYANILIAIFAGAALQLLAGMQWTLTGLRKISLAIIFCGLLFSTVSQVFLIARLPPLPEFQQGFEGVMKATLPDARILAHPGQGLWLAYYARREPATHDLGGGRAADGLALLHSQDLARTKALLAELDATHVLLTKDLVGTIWPRKGLGLNFLVNDGETFKRVYADDFMTVWQVRTAPAGGG